MSVAGKAHPSRWTPVLNGHQVGRIRGVDESYLSEQGSGWHLTELTEPMVGGWDAAVWARAGLPLSGKLVLKLKVTKVAHSC
jgi:hypothetical protein